MHNIKNRSPGLRTWVAPPAMEFHLPDPNLLSFTSPWDLDFRQMEPGPLQTRIWMRQGRMLSLLEISMDRKVHQMGAAPVSALTMGIPLSPGVQKWRGTNARWGSMFTFGQSDGFEGVTNGGFHGITFSIPDRVIENLSDRLGIPIEDWVRNCGVLDVARSRHIVQKLSVLALQLLDLRSRHPLDAANEEQLTFMLLELLNNPEKLRDKSTHATRARALRIELECMEAHADSNLTISSNCGLTNVSIQTLNRAFVEKFGVSPKTNFLRLRLGYLRTSLINRNENELITDIANDLGFWHMGQLARDYKALFGELPSTTKSRFSSQQFSSLYELEESGSPGRGSVPIPGLM